MKAVCIVKGCRNSFEITANEYEWLRARQMVLPKRCLMHRGFKKMLRGGMYHVLGGEFQRYANH